ncbi:FtsL-like putative cell division protein [Blattabacterium cuenoti]|uniref:FtsL-like putative cell division protein n=1 Tax=Blattabacterium cuenoti TaxID=1653831 RepID=UPI00163D3594|nr:FtsL-like putative cell division protein [Blattabacterium cuenoti]
MKIQDILKGKFLVEKQSYHNWNFIVFITFLSLISITSSHIMDQEIRKITKINEEIKELKSEYASIQSRYIKIKLLSVLKTLLQSTGLKNLEYPPYEVILKDEK